MAIDRQFVVGTVVEPPHAIEGISRGRPGVGNGGTFAGVVVDHVHIDLDADIVERLDHRLELGGRPPGSLVRRIAPVGGEIGDRHVAPIIVVVILPRIPAGVAVGRRRAAMCGVVDVVLVVLHLLHGLQFDGGDAQALQVSGLLCRARVSAALGLLDRTIVGCHSAHVHLIDDVVLLRPGRLGPERVGRGRDHDSLGRDLLSVVIPLEFAGRTLFNSGAYGGYRPTANMRSAYGTSYRIPAANIEVVRVYTNEVPCGNMRAPGAPQTCYAMEAMMDFVARGLGINPFEFRRLNVLHDGETTLMGHAWPESRGLETLDAADQATPPAQPSNAPANLRFGRGVALYDRPTHAPQHTSLRLRLAEDGRIEAQVPIMETGTGSHTMLQRVLATALGLEREDVFMRYVGTAYLPWDEGVGGSRVTVSAAEAGVLGAKAFIAAVRAEAATQLGVPLEQVEVRPGGVCVDKLGGRQIGLTELAGAGARIEAMGETSEPEEAEGATSFCAQVAQVAVDTETGQVFLTEFASVHDVAEILDLMLHRGQIEGGIAMGMGFALSEDLGLVEGQVTATHLGDYKLPTIADVPPLKVVLLPGGEGVGARNIKSIGEIGNVPVGAAPSPTRCRTP